MSDWTEGYVAELDYTYGYYREQNPAVMDFVALCQGRRSPDLPGEGLTYCELGCGQGYALNLLAAANPDIQFYANDFNPPQIAGARALAAEGGLGNVHFSDASFQDYIDDPSLPQFDFITLHGIYSWVSPENRRIIVDFLRRKLKVGGLVYISFNTLPGWAGGAPLRRLFWDAGARAGGTVASRIQTALAFAERMKNAGGGYFRDVHGAAGRLNSARNKPVNYFAHEYFGRDWNPMYFGDVAAELGGAKLDYVGSVWLFDHVDEISLTPEHRAVLGEVADPTFKETVRDYLTMNQFRRDLFGRGPVSLTSEERRLAWLDLRLALSIPRQSFPLSIDGRVGTVSLRPDIYQPLMDALAKGPSSVRALLEDPKVNAIGTAPLIEAIKVIVGTGAVQPCLPAKGEAARTRHAKAFNTALMKRALSSADLVYLASPVTGGGQVVEQLQQLFLLGLEEKVADVAGWAWAAVDAQNQSLTKDGKAIQSAEENLAEMRRRFEVFNAAVLPVLKQLGIA